MTSNLMLSNARVKHMSDTAQHQPQIHPTIEAIVRQCADFLAPQQLAEKTVTNYLSDIRLFLEWSSGQHQGLFLKELENDIHAYRAALLDSATPIATINRHLASLRQFGAFLTTVHQIEVNTKSLKNISVKPQKPDSTPSNTNDQVIEQFGLALAARNCSHSTIENYLGDVRQFAVFASDITLFDARRKDCADKFMVFLRENSASNATVRRKKVSLKQFYAWAKQSEYIKSNIFETFGDKIISVAQKFVPLAFFEKKGNEETAEQQSQHPLTRAYHTYTKWPVSSYLHLAILVLFVSMLGAFGYKQLFLEAGQKYAFPTSLTRPNRILSFQGRLTDSAGTPITVATNLKFRLFNHITNGTGDAQALWASGTCSITPDQDGIFTSLLGSACGPEIPPEIFSENQNVYLEVQVSSETLTPRQQIATVGYALNAETLKGYPASASAVENTVPVFDNNGDMVIGLPSPEIRSTSGTFALKGNALSLATNTGTGGNVTIAPDGVGQISLIGGTTSQDFIDITNANLTTGKLIKGTVGNNNTGYKFLSFVGGSTPSEKFYVNALGGVYAGNSFFAPVATISATNTSATPLIINGTGGQIFSIANGGNIVGAGTLMGLTGLTSSGTITFSGLNTAGAVAYTNGSGVLGVTAQGVSGYLLGSGGSGTPTWIDPATVGSNYWQLTNKVISPGNSTHDLAIGGNATSSALFQVFGNTGNATTSGTLTFNGAAYSNNVIAATKMSGLQIGNSSTGNIIFNQNGNVGVGTTGPGYKLDITGDVRLTTDLTVGDQLIVSGVGPHAIGSATNSVIQLELAGTFSGNQALRVNSTLNVPATGEGHGLNVQPTLVEASSGTHSYLTGIRVNPTITNGAASVTTAAGIGVFGFTAGTGTTNAANVYINDAPSGATNNYALWVNSGTSIFGGNVGIGNTGPARKLEVAGTYDQDEIRTSASGHSAGIGVDARATYWGVGIFQDGVKRLNIDSTGGVAIGSTYVNENAPTNALLVEGSVGIGNLLPTYKLDVTGSASVSANLMAGGQVQLGRFGANPTGIGAGALYFNTTDSKIYYYDGSSWSQVGSGAGGNNSPWDELNGAIVPKNSTEDVLIGGQATTSAKFAFINVNTGTPVASFSGNLTLTPATSAIIQTTNMIPLVIGSASTGSIQLSPKASTGLFINGSGNVGIGNTAPTVALDVTGQGKFSSLLTASNALTVTTGLTQALGGLTVSGNNVAASGQNFEAFVTSGTAYVQGYDRGGSAYIPLNIAGSYTKFSNGSVGIGTTGAPAEKLEINSGAAAGGIRLNADTSFNTRLVFYENNALKAGLTYTASDATLRLSNAGSDILTLTSAGKVGVGNTAPDGKFQVTGSAVGKALAILNETGDQNIFVASASGTNRFVITNAGNVGIGTTGPGAPLAFANTLVDKIYLYANGADKYGFGLDASGHLNIFGGSGADTNIRTGGPSGTALMTLKSTGNVGIGTTGPATKLEVTGSGGETARFSGVSTPYITIGNGLTSTTGGYVQWDDTNNLMHISPHGLQALTINSGGNVGIGTTAPSAKLHIAGDMRLTGALYDVNNGVGTNGQVLSSTVAGVDWVDISSIGVGGSGTTNYLPKWTASSTLGNSVLYETSGNIGIGTTAPSAKLELATGNIAAASAGFSTGAPTLVSRFDGPKPDETDYTGNPNGNLGQAATVTGGVIHRPGKFGKGVQIAEATTNLVRNPSLETNSADWGYDTSNVRDTTVGYFGTSSNKIASGNGVGSSVYYYHSANLSATTQYTGSNWFKGKSGDSFRLCVGFYSGSWTWTCSTDATATGDWQRVSVTATSLSSWTDFQLRFEARSTLTGNAYADGFQIEQKAYVTPYADGSLGNGHSWSGTAHASTSSRTAAGLTYPLTGNAYGGAGTVSFWFYANSYTANPALVDLSNSVCGGLRLFAYALGHVCQTGAVGSVWASSDLNSWNHISFTWSEGNTTTPTIKAYKNGTLIGSSTSNAPIVLITPIDLLRVNQEDQYRTNGQVDDFAIFPTALSAQEIYSIYKSNAPLQTEDQSSVLSARSILPIDSRIDLASGNLYIDATNSRIGIGTTSPQNKLHLDGTANNYYEVSSSGANNDVGIQMTDTNGDYANLRKTWYWRHNTSDNKLYLDYFAAPSTFQLSNIVVQNNGNVGIGITGPTKSLDVRGTGILVRPASDQNEVLQLTNAAGTTYVDFSSLTTPRLELANAANFEIFSDNFVTSKFKVTGSSGQTYIAGNVGIGNTSPTYKLDVTGSASVSANLMAGGQVQLGRFGGNPTAIGVGSLYYNTSDYNIYYNQNGSWTALTTGSIGTNYWRLASGALSPINDTLDLLVGANTTASAKFAVNATTGNVTVTGTLTLPNSNTLTGITNYTQLSNGISFGGATTYSVTSAGVASLNTLDLAGSTLTSPGNLQVTLGGAATKVIINKDLQISGQDILGELGSTRITLLDSLTKTSISGHLDVSGTFTTASGNFVSSVPDGSSAVLYNLDTSSAISNASAKLLSLKNNGTEKLSVDKDGNLWVAGTILSSNGQGMLMTNKSGGTVAVRSLVVIDTANNSAFTTTTTAYNKAAYGVVTGVGVGVTNDANGDGICNANDICMVAVSGEVNVTTTNASTAVKGDYLYTSATAGSAVASAKQFDGLIGVVSSTANAASGYLKMIFKVQPQVTAAASIDKGSKHNEYWLYANKYTGVGEGSDVNANLLTRGLVFDNLMDTTKTDSANTTVSLPTQVQDTSATLRSVNSASAPFRAGLMGGQTLATSTTDNAGNTYLGSNTVNKTVLYDRTRDSSPQVQVELGIDPNWYNGVTLSVATTSASFSSNSTNWSNKSNPNLSTTYNGSLVKATGTYATAAAARTIYITIKSPTTFDWTDYNGNSATGTTITPGTAQTLTGTGVSVTFTNVRYNTGDVFKIASWFVEPASSTRGGTAKFPERSTIIATASSVDIINADTQKLWMRFSQGTNYAIGVDANNDPSSANMLNGKAYISTNGSAATGLYTLDFVHDAAFRQNATDWRLSDQPLAQRNGTNTYNVLNTSNILVNATANDVSAAVIPNQPTQTVTVSGWGYIAGAAAAAINESVNFPYKFNQTPNVLIQAAGEANSAPTTLASCGNSNIQHANFYSPSTTSFWVMMTNTDASNFNASRFYCYTWTATGQVSPRQYVAVATGATSTDGGVTVINETDQSAVNEMVGSQHANILWSNKISLLGDGMLYFVHNDDTANCSIVNVYKNVPTLTSEASLTANRSGSYGTTGSCTGVYSPAILVPATTNSINALYSTQGTSVIDGKSNTIYVGTSTGLTVLQEKQSGGNVGDGSDENNGSVKYYTKDYISEEMVGDIRGMWPFSGSTPNNDASVKATNLTKTGSAALVTGVRGTAASFDGSTYYTNTSGNTSLSGSSTMSVGMWFKWPSGNTTMSALMRSNTITNQWGGYEINMNNRAANKIEFGPQSATGYLCVGYDVTSNKAVNDGNWHYFTGTIDGTTCKVYIDGQLDNSAAQSGSIAYAAGANTNIQLGRYDITNVPNGTVIDEPFVTATALTAGQIKHMYEVGYRALQSHAATLGGGGADLNQQLGGTTNTIGAVGVDYNNQFMYVGTNSTTLGAVSKIDLNSDTNIKTYNSSANVPTGGPLLIDEDTKSLAVGYNLEAVGSAASGVKTMGVDNNATATSGNFISKTITTAESFTQAYIWSQHVTDSSDASNTVTVWASNDGGTNYYQCNQTNADTSQTPTEYEYFCQFNAAGSSLKIKEVFARGSTKTNTYVTRYGIAWIGSDAVGGAPGGNGLYTNTNSSVANGSYIEVAHNQNSNDLVTNGWVNLNGQWKSISTATESGVISATNTSVANGSYIDVAHNQNTNDPIVTGWKYNSSTSKWESIDDIGGDATGGTITYSGGYTIHTFTTSGTFTSGPGTVEYLVVGGGGGGGRLYGGGGGAGGFRTGTLSVSGGAVSVTVGAGGQGASTNLGGNGGDSIFSTITSTGGGGGGYYNGVNGVSGGSGGGGGGGASTGGTGTGGQGYAGGNGTTQGAGGGGGSSAVGSNAPGTNLGGNGGAGTSSSISGSAVTYAGGGGGGTESGTTGTGAAGGGNGGTRYVSGGNATTNSGSGGGGGGDQSGAVGGNGGSGIVIVRYLTNSLSAFKIVQQDANTVRLYNYSGATQNLRLDVSTQAFQVKQVDTNTVRLYNYSGATQNLRLDVITGGLGRNAGTVSLAPAAADTDSQSNVNSIWVNKTGSGGNLLKLQTSGTDMTLINNLGDITAGITTLDGSTTANGAGTNSTTLILTSATNFDVGNYVKVSSTNCVTGVNVCYAKITAIATNTLTISPALTWANASAVVEVHVPELGGIDTSQALANRYGRGYFIDGIVTGNGSSYFTDNLINFGGGTKVMDSSGKLQLQAGGTGTGSTGTGSIYFLNSSGTTRARLDTAGVSSTEDPVNATGGTITTNGGYTIHTFTSSGTFTPGVAGNVEYLVVGGGGGGSCGGGGAGAVRTATGFAVTAQAYTITVGAGGSGGNNVAANGSAGGDSVFSTITASGGGYGAHQDIQTNGGNGGSGGGGGYGGTGGTGGTGGNAGGGSVQTGDRGCGGGGGGSAVGANGTTSGGGNGGNGTASSISGSSVTYGGGGGGGNFGSTGTNGTGGSGGGGNAAAAGSKSGGSAGTANRGGGGGGAADGPNPTVGAVGGAGGSGIVIIRYPTTNYGTLYLSSTNTSSADLAEYYVSGDGTIEAGDVVIISQKSKVKSQNGEDVETKGVLMKAEKAYDGKLIGIISTNPGVLMGSIDGENKEDKRMLALAGRVPVKIDPDSPPIAIGDFLTSSSKPGYAMKATKAGYTVGKALESWAPNGSDRIEAFVHLGWYIGELTADGYLDTQSKFLAKDMKIQLSATASAEFASWSLYTPIASESAANPATNSHNPFISLSQVISELVNRVKNLELNQSTTPISPVAEIDTLYSSTISAQTVTVENASVSGTLYAVDLSSQNATFSGEVVADSVRVQKLQAALAEIESFKALDAQISGNATVSGTLYADNINALSILGLDDKISSAVQHAMDSATASGAITYTPPTSTLELISSLIADTDASTSAYIALLNSKSGSNVLDTEVITPTAVLVNEFLSVQGLANFNYAEFSTGLTVNGSNQALTVTGNSISLASTGNNDNMNQSNTLYIQPSGSGSLSLLGNRMVLSDSGDVSINGNLYVNGSIYTKDIQTETVEIGFTSLLGSTASDSAMYSPEIYDALVNASSSAVLTVGPGTSNRARLLALYNNKGELVSEITASGSATFQDLTTKMITIAAPSAPLASSTATDSASATQSATLTGSAQSNASAATAVLPAGDTQLTIANTNVAPNTLIYLTPVSNTENQVLYVSAKNDGQGFTVAINQPVTHDITFNYWLIRVQ